MTAIEEIARFKKEIEALRLQRERLVERLETDKIERARLMDEAKSLGIDDSKKLSIWITELEEKYKEKRTEIEKMLREASGK